LNSILEKIIKILYFEKPQRDESNDIIYYLSLYFSRKIWSK